ncbi:MAG: helix-hairpin-helix domain-containing protein, partial [Clostridia bacterium]
MLCTYERTLYENPSNGFCISSFVTDDTSVPNTARNKKVTDNRIHFTAKGYDIPKTSAINLNLEGEWEESKYGLQFSISSFEEIIPQTKEGITAYLSSGLIKGVGEKTAKNIVDTFGVDTLKVFDEAPNKLTQIRGITPKKLNKIINSYNKSRY